MIPQTGPRARTGSYSLQWHREGFVLHLFLWQPFLERKEGEGVMSFTIRDLLASGPDAGFLDHLLSLLERFPFAFRGPDLVA